MKINKHELEQKYIEEEFSINDCAKFFGVAVSLIKKHMVLYSIPARKFSDKTKRTLSKLKSNKNLGCHTKAYFQKIKDTGVTPPNELVRRAKIGKAMTGREFTWGDKISEALTGENNPMYGRTGDKHPNFLYTDEYLLQKLKGMVKPNGEPPKVKDIGSALLDLLVRRFGSFNNALKLIGLEGRPAGGVKKYTDQEIIDAIKSHSKDGFAPTEKEINTLASTAIYRFGSYSAAVKLAGLKHQSNGRSGEENCNWKGGYKDYYGPNWQQQRKLVRERDNYQCQLCSITEKDLGRQMDVHHKIPFREFNYVPSENDYYLNANKIDNLISLCYKCHARITNGSNKE